MSILTGLEVGQVRLKFAFRLTPELLLILEYLLMTALCVFSMKPITTNFFGYLNFTI